MPQENTRIFLSYAREDQPVVAEIYRFLSECGCDPWMDVEKLLPGQDWQLEIDKAIEESRYFIACLSTRSVDKTGIVQREIRRGLDRLELFPPGKIFLIPLRLDDCVVPRHLTAQQWLDWFTPSAPTRLLRAVGAAEGLEELERLTYLLREGKPGQRKQAAWNIGQTRHAKAVIVLSMTYRMESEADVRHWIALSIGHLGTEEARAALLRLKEWEEGRPDSSGKLFALGGIAKALGLFDV